MSRARFPTNSAKLTRFRLLAFLAFRAYKAFRDLRDRLVWLVSKGLLAQKVLLVPLAHPAQPALQAPLDLLGPMGPAARLDSQELRAPPGLRAQRGRRGLRDL
jgi:hypothetical protein